MTADKEVERRLGDAAGKRDMREGRTDAPPRTPPDEQLASMVRRVTLAKQGLCQCDCGCQRVVPLKEALVTTYRGNIVQALALPCFGPRVYILRRTPEGINIQIRPSGDVPLRAEPSRIVPASGISDARAIKQLAVEAGLQRKGG